MAVAKPKVRGRKPKSAKKAREDLKTMAKNLFEAAGKEAYYLGDKAIHNIQDLVDNLEHFTEREAEWVADWIDYLGDGKTAKNIRKKKGDFVKIIQKRYKELKKHR
jgi:hypothetical protein